MTYFILKHQAKFSTNWGYQVADNCSWKSRWPTQNTVIGVASFQRCAESHCKFDKCSAFDYHADSKVCRLYFFNPSTNNYYDNASGYSCGYLIGTTTGKTVPQPVAGK